MLGKLIKKKMKVYIIFLVDFIFFEILKSRKVLWKRSL